MTPMSFIQTILERPDDPGPRLVFADWLEEQGECKASEMLRVENPGNTATVPLDMTGRLYRLDVNNESYQVVEVGVRQGDLLLTMCIGPQNHVVYHAPRPGLLLLGDAHVTIGPLDAQSRIHFYAQVGRWCVNEDVTLQTVVRDWLNRILNRPPSLVQKHSLSLEVG